MTNYTNTGNLMHLYLDEIQPGALTHASNFLIKATANTLKEKGGRNWIPIIVKEIGEDSYQVIGNSFIYAVAKQAGLERAWCIIADDNDDTVALTKILAGETFPKINLSTASRDDIVAALQYLIEQPGNPIKGIKLDVAVNQIDKAPRQFWQNFDPVVNLKCGITKTRLDALESVFYLTPQEPPIETLEPEPPTSKQKTKTTTKAASKAKPKPETSGVTSIDKMNVSQLKELAKERGITVTSKMKKADLLELLR
jgi:hypothetical protein